MVNYRDLNKEFAEQVQTMRQNIKLYCDEIVHLKAELMEKYESEVLLRKRCYNWAVNNFVQLIQFVQPDSDILPVLKDHLQQQVIIFNATSNSTERTHSMSRSDKHRRSSLLTKQFQKSNSIINLRPSPCSTSPIRRSSLRTSEVDGYEEAVDDDERKKSMELAENKLTHDSIIFEETGEEESDSDYCPDIVSVNESVEEETIDLTLKKSTRARRTKKKNLICQESYTDELSKENFDIDNTNKTNKQTSLVNSSNKNTEEQTMQEPRRCSLKQNSDTNKSFFINQNNIHSHNDEIFNSTNFTYTELTLRNFNDAACSTPNSRANSLKEKPNSKTATELESTLQATSTNTSSRPSRSCKPKNLAEPRINIKQRNDNQTKSKKTTRTKRKK